ncbi:MAG: hypothetical protein HC851_17375 [Acaryochloris sp. RU_4_1]|nr:hypothetical protein [Acaryochloris sp. RU_4_1]NJR56843.1 hypothetical protein [Acaryochloris sp. CRU_2_0]
MSRTTTALIGAAIGIFLGASGVCLGRGGEGVGVAHLNTRGISDNA